MIGYVTLGAKDLERAGAFYDALTAALGARRVMANQRSIVWGSLTKGGGIIVNKPFDKNDATVGNGMMVAFECRDRAHVDEIYKLAMSLGAQDEGPPGQRMPTFYAAYFRDLDGNKLNAFFMG